MKPMHRAYDIILWGSTGFTGQLVARYFAEVLRLRVPGLRWALVGRDAAKLSQLSASLAPLCDSCAPDILVASAATQSEVDRVVEQARIVLSTAGPFARIGQPVVDACVRLGTHYVDINGEPGWHREMIERYDEAARAKGVVLIPSSGFDSIPSDMACQWMAERVAVRFGKPARRVSAYVAMQGGMSGGTVLSGILSEEAFGRSRLADPYLLGPPRHGEPRREDADVSEALWDGTVGSWTAPFAMAQINTRIVRRSVALLAAVAPAAAARLYSADFTYTERALAPDEARATKMARASEAPASKIRSMQQQGRLPQPGQGPSAEQRQANWFRFVLVAEAAGGDPARRLFGSVSGGDAGYDETAKMVSEAALMLLERTGQGARAPRGGFCTPATALGAPLRERLHEVGICFDELDELPRAAPVQAKL